MLTRYLVMFAVVFAVAACSTTQDEPMMDGQFGVERDEITSGPLSEIYDGVQDQGPVPGTQADLVVNVGDRVFFGYDRYDISEEARRILDSQANWLAQYPGLDITIEGHADERGTREYNLALGERRANAVRNYLIAAGIDPRRINTISYGKERPAVPGANEAAWAQNRRAVIKVD